MMNESEFTDSFYCCWEEQQQQIKQKQQKTGERKITYEAINDGWTKQSETGCECKEKIIIIKSRTHSELCACVSSSFIYLIIFQSLVLSLSLYLFAPVSHSWIYTRKQSWMHKMAANKIQKQLIYRSPVWSECFNKQTNKRTKARNAIHLKKIIKRTPCNRFAWLDVASAIECNT